MTHPKRITAIRYGFRPVVRRRPGAALAASLIASLMAGPGPAQSQAQSQAQSRAEPTFTPLPGPTLNFYGSAGLIDMPTGEMLPDGQVATALSHFGGQTRFTMTFQATPWMSASFRYNAIRNWNMGGFATYYDRGFDARFRLLRERRRWPAITLGLQDFVGTGIYAGEYLVATKSFPAPGRDAFALPGRLKLTAGLGWGRLGSYGAIADTGPRPGFTPGGTGGRPAYDQWFRGPVAPFGGIEWLPSDRVGLKLEYSSDAYVTETVTTSVFRRRSQINFGAEYQVSDRIRLGAYYLYGSEFGLNARIQLNPRHPPTRMAVPAPLPIVPRSVWAARPGDRSTAWAASREAPAQLRDALAPVLRANGLMLESLDVSADTAELRFRNLQYYSFANAVGRAARVLAQTMPASVGTFRLIPVQDGMALSATIIRRSDLEALEFDAAASEALLARTRFTDAPPLADGALPAVDVYPGFSWSLGPYFSPAYFDPARPIRMDVGAELRATLRPAPGWIVSGTLRQRIAGNIKDGRGSNSVLAHVRTDQVLYAQSDTTMDNLFVTRQWRPGRNLYARLTAGYLEAMYGGLLGEVLWKPVDSRLGLGVEASYVRQRDYDQKLGLRDYGVFTGYASAYYDFGAGFEGQLDVGRYLAGDVGATFSLDRYFDNGWMVGGFFTLTNVSAADFGEGSFDKGIRFRIPLGWFLGQPSRQAIGTTIRPIQRDGGQKLRVPGRLFGQVRKAHQEALSGQWARAWE